MAYRDDGDALLARLEALEQLATDQAATLVENASTISIQAAHIAKLEAELAALRDELLEHEAKLVDQQRRMRVEPTGPLDTSGKTAEEAAELYLAHGIERYRRGDRPGATAAFERGLAYVPAHAGLQRALRRYT